MTDKTYAEKLKDPRWQKFRLKIFERDYWQCMRCDCETKELHAHHLNYVGNRNPWNYEEHTIVTLCSDCHKEAHGDNAEIIYKEICPVSFMSNFHSEYSDFKDIFNMMLPRKFNKNDEMSVEDFYCKSIKAYFSDTEINFTTRENILKRLKFNYYPFELLAISLNQKYSEDIKYIILSQKYIDVEYISLSNSIEELIGQVIKNYCAEDILYYSAGYKPSDSDYYGELDGVFIVFILKTLLNGSILHGSLHKDKREIYAVRIDDFIKKIKEFNRANEMKNKFYDIHLYDQDKWIETFDCIEWNPS